VPQDFFVQTYLGSIEIVRQAIERFGEQIVVDVFQKSANTSPDVLIPEFEQVCRVASIADLDEIVVKKYNARDLREEIAFI
jgi:hypothetical protein